VGDRTSSLGALLLALAACKAGPPSAQPTPAAPQSSEPLANEAGARSEAPPPPPPTPPPADDRGRVVVRHSHECGYILDHIYFEHNSASLRDTQRPIVDETAVMFRCALRTGEVTKWQVIGNTDVTEQDPAALSLSRARTVAAALVARGVAAATLDISGAGATQPLDPRGTPEARAKNRRVSFFVLKRADESP
jgi:outer membrane protein OmpA-like peptidoglycan-associated protein